MDRVCVVAYAVANVDLLREHRTGEEVRRVVRQEVEEAEKLCEKTQREETPAQLFRVALKHVTSKFDVTPTRDRLRVKTQNATHDAAIIARLFRSTKHGRVQLADA